MKKSLYLLLLIMLTNQLHSQIAKNMPAVAGQTLSCSLSGPELDERNRLMKQYIKPLINEVNELEKGYSFSFDFSTESLEQLSSFIGLEKKCCSFITYKINLPAGEEAILVEIFGSTIEDKKLIRSCWQIK